MIPTKKIYFIATAEYAVNAFLLSHIRELSKKFDITVIVNSKNPAFLKEQGLDVEVVAIEISRKINWMSDVSCLFFLVFYFLKNRPIAVHSITPKAGLLAMLAGFITHIPLRIHTFTGQVWVNKHGIKKVLLKSLDFLMASLSTHNVVDSPSQRDFLIFEGVLSQKKSVVFGKGSVSGVDLSRFRPNKRIRNQVRKALDIPPDAFLFVFAGRMTRDKGIFDLVNAFVRLNNPQAYLLFVGPDEEVLISEVRGKLGKLCSNFRYIGYSRDVASYFAASDVFCIPSYREGFGSALIEAAASGLPAIASRIYGLTDAVVDKETGFLHQPHDVNQISIFMQMMIKDNAKYKKMSVAARYRVKKDFDQKIITRMWLDFYLAQIPD